MSAQNTQLRIYITTLETKPQFQSSTTTRRLAINGRGTHPKPIIHHHHHQSPLFQVPTQYQKQQKNASPKKKNRNFSKIFGLSSSLALLSSPSLSLSSPPPPFSPPPLNIHPTPPHPHTNLHSIPIFPLPTIKKTPHSTASLIYVTQRPNSKIFPLPPFFLLSSSPPLFFFPVRELISCHLQTMVLIARRDKRKPTCMYSAI